MSMTMERHDRAFMDFVEGLRTFAVQGLSGPQRKLWEQKKQEFEAEHGRTPETIEDVAEVMDPTPLARYRGYLQRRSQELIWGGLHNILKPQEEELLRRINEYAGQSRYGKIELDPELEIPHWFSSVDIHIQPGAYWGDDMTGYVYDEAARLYSFGTGRERDINYAVARALPRNDYKRILDLGSGIGKSTIPLKEIFPEAEVTGIDLSAAMVKYAHMVAEEKGIGVNFSQQNAERLKFPDASFDLVQAAILFHEVPPKSVEKIFAEVYRVLEPGGNFVIGDVQPWREMDPLGRWVSNWQIRHNGEPYWRSAVDQDFKDILKKVGFKNIWEGFPANYPDRYRFLTIAEK